MPCGCGSSVIVSQCNQVAQVCQGSHVLINATCSTPTITNLPLHGTVTYSNITNTFTYIHNGIGTITDNFSFYCGEQSCNITIEVQEALEETEKIIVLTAEADCEVGNPTFMWNLPPCASLVSGYSLTNQTIHVIVNTYNPTIPLEQQVCEITVTVCCGSCSNCCKCKKFHWTPPICIGNCESETCRCPLPCTTYNQNTGNCEETCTSEVVQHCVNQNNAIGLSGFGTVNNFKCSLQSGINGEFPTAAYFGNSSAVNNFTGEVNFTQLTNIINGDLTINTPNGAILVAFSSISGDHSLKFSELNGHSNAQYYLHFLQDSIFGFIQENPCGTLKRFYRLDFSSGFATSLTAAELNANSDLKETTITGKTIKPVNKCCLETIKKSCCAEEDCISTSLLNISKNNTKLILELSASVAGGVWTSSEFLIDGNACFFVGNQEVLTHNGTTTIITPTTVRKELVIFDSAGLITNPNLNYILLYSVGNKTVPYLLTVTSTGNPVANGSLLTNTQFTLNILPESKRWCYSACTYLNEFCSECCNSEHCVPLLSSCLNPPRCVNGECKCFVQGSYVEPNSNGCCPECLTDVGCRKCVDGVLLPLPACLPEEVLNSNCECECNCSAGYCIDLLEPNPQQKCKPCPSGCSVTLGQWLHCGVPLQIVACSACEYCLDGVCTPIVCTGTTCQNNTGQAPCCVPCCSLTISNVNTLCDLETLTYTLSLVINYAHQPTGTLILNIGGTTYTHLPDGTSPDTFIINNLSASVVSNVLIVAYFNNNTSCTAQTTYTSPTCVAFCDVPTTPVLSVAQNICPSQIGSFFVTTPCEAGTEIEYSINNGVTWTSTIMPSWTAGTTLISRCVRTPICYSVPSVPVTAQLTACPGCNTTLTGNYSCTQQEYLISIVSSTCTFNLSGLSIQTSSGTNVTPTDINTIGNTTVISIATTIEEIIVNYIDCNNCVLTQTFIKDCPACVQPTFSTTLNCDTQTTVQSISFYNVVSTCTSNTVNVSILTLTGQTYTVSGIITGTSGDIVLPPIMPITIVSITGTFTCDAACPATFNVPVTCHGFQNKQCAPASEEALTSIILFDSSTRTGTGFAEQKILAKKIAQDLFSIGSLVGFVDFDHIVNTYVPFQNSSISQINLAIDNTNLINSSGVNLDCPLYLAVRKLLAYNGTNPKHIILITDGFVGDTKTCVQCFSNVSVDTCFDFNVSPQGNGTSIIIPQNIKLSTIAYNSSYNAVNLLTSLSNSVYVTTTAEVETFKAEFVNSLFINTESECLEVSNRNLPITCNCSPTFGYSCANCLELVMGGTYATTQECTTACNQETCVISFINPTINGGTSPLSKYQLICQNGQAVCIQNDSATTNFVTNSSCIGLTQDCSPINVGGKSCVFYQENTISEPTLILPIFNLIKAALEHSEITGQQTTARLTYSFISGTIDSFSDLLLASGVTIQQAKDEIQEAFDEISNLFSCLFPKLTLEFVNKNGGHFEEVANNTTTYGNIRIGSYNAPGIWASASQISATNDYLWNNASNVFSSTTPMRRVRFSTSGCFRLNSMFNLTTACRSIKDNFIHEMGHVLGFAHSQGVGNVSCSTTNCTESTGCSSGSNCCNPVTEVLCGCGSTACEQWTNWSDSPYYVKAVYNYYKPNSLDYMEFFNSQTNNITCQ